MAENELVVYESDFTEIASLEQAEEEVSFLRKAYDLGMFNKMFYSPKRGEGFHGEVKKQNIEGILQKIIEDSKAGRLPIEYAIGLNAGFDGTKVNPRIFEEE